MVQRGEPRVSGGATLVMVVHTNDVGNGSDPAIAGRLLCSRARRVVVLAANRVAEVVLCKHLAIDFCLSLGITSRPASRRIPHASRGTDGHRLVRLRRSRVRSRGNDDG
jgi:hypothetical protein